MDNLKNELQAALGSSIVPDPGEMYPDPNAQSDTKKLRAALQRWQSHLSGKPGEQLQYVFYGHSWYFLSYLEVEGNDAEPEDERDYRKILDGDDKQPFNATRSVAAELGYDVFFAETTKTAEQEDEDAVWDDEYDDEYEDEDEDEYFGMDSGLRNAIIEIDVLRDLDGYPLVKTTESDLVELDESNELGDGFLGPPEDEYVDRSTYSRTVMEVYRAAVLVIMPRQMTADFLWRFAGSGNGVDVSNSCRLMSYFSSRVLEMKDNLRYCEILRDLCSRFLDSWKKLIPEEYVVDMFRVSFCCHDQGLFDLACRGIGQGPALDHIAWVCDNLPVEELFLEAAGKSLPKIINSLENLTNQLQAVRLLSSKGVDKPHLGRLVPSIIDQCVKYTQTQRRASDGSSLVELALDYQGVEWLHQTALPIIKRDIQNAPFVIGFIERLFEDSDQVSRDDRNELCEAIIPELLAAFDVQSFSSSEPLFELSTIEPMPMPWVRPETLARFSVRLIEEGGRDMFDKLIAKLTDKVAKAHPRDLPLLYIPYLRMLVEILQTAGTPLSLPLYQPIFRAVFITLLDRRVGKEPSHPTGLRVKPVSCQCEDCVHLNCFLMNPSQVKYIFRGVMQHCHHLENKIRASGTPCNHAIVRFTPCNKMTLCKEFHKYDGSMEAWGRRKQLTEREVLRFSQTTLAIFLGEDYHRIMAMDGYMAPEPPAWMPPTEYHPPYAACENKEKVQIQATGRERQRAEDMTRNPPVSASRPSRAQVSFQQLNNAQPTGAPFWIPHQTQQPIVGIQAGRHEN